MAVGTRTDIPAAGEERLRPPPTAVVRRRRSRRLRKYWIALLFLSPWIVGFVAFYLYPMVSSLYFSFTHYDLLSQPHWVGLANYRFMFTSDPQFWQSVVNTLWIVAIATPLQVVFALGCGLVLTQIKRGGGFYRTLFFLPTMVPAVAAALGFLFLLNPSGPIDSFLRVLHVPQPLWFQ